MNKEKLSFFSAITSLKKKKDVQLDTELKLIRILHNLAKFKVHDLGNGSWGKIDYLKKYHGYKTVYVSKF